MPSATAVVSNDADHGPPTAVPIVVQPPPPAGRRSKVTCTVSPSALAPRLIVPLTFAAGALSETPGAKLSTVMLTRAGRGRVAGDVADHGGDRRAAVAARRRVPAHLEGRAAGGPDRAAVDEVLDAGDRVVVGGRDTERDAPGDRRPGERGSDVARRRRVVDDLRRKVGRVRVGGLVRDDEAEIPRAVVGRRSSPSLRCTGRWCRRRGRSTCCRSSACAGTRPASRPLRRGRPCSGSRSA